MVKGLVQLLTGHPHLVRKREIVAIGKKFFVVAIDKPLINDF
jgi:hypothetical protein